LFASFFFFCVHCLDMITGYHQWRITFDLFHCVTLWLSRYTARTAGLDYWPVGAWGSISTIAAGPRQRNHSRVPVPRDSRPYFTVSDSRLPQLGGPGPRMFIDQEQGGPVIPPGTGLPFRRVIHFAGLRWRYSNQPPRGVCAWHRDRLADWTLVVT
jgi:hypothetical protein